MSMTQITADISPSGEPRCPHCNANLPPGALFCPSCGERISKKSAPALLEDDREIAARYRKTSLLHRRAYISLFFAIDNQQQRQVAMRDIDISSLPHEQRLDAYRAVQQEYDLLRRQDIPFIMPAIDMGYSQGHIYMIAGWPVTNERKARGVSLHTLQDILQSGIGLPGIPVVLSWMEQLCQALEQLHHDQIVVADLDPHVLILDSNTYNGKLALSISWLPEVLYSLLPPTTVTGNTNFMAPEALLGKPDPRSDIYSLGAMLYLLLTGTPPDDSTRRLHHRFRSPAELNSHVSSELDGLVMRALALDSSERFQSISEMLDALARLRSGASRQVQAKETPIKAAPAAPTPETRDESLHERQPTIQHAQKGKKDTAKLAGIESIDTIVVAPQPLSPIIVDEQNPQVPATEFPASPQVTPVPSIEEIREEVQPEAGVPAQEQPGKEKLPGFPATILKSKTKETIKDSFKKRVTGVLPLVKPAPVRNVEQTKESSPLSGAPQAEAPASGSLVPYGAKEKERPAPKKPEQPTSGLLKRLQQLILGEQKLETTAAAVIETPLRVQPDQIYAIRIQLMGRNRPEDAGGAEAMAKMPQGGLSSLAEGDLVQIEVRSALYQNYAFIVQQASVPIPAYGYAVEVTIPMRPLASGPSGRRDRLHIFFMDEMRRPLYEKPFVIELFISHRVQPGREGHNVLTIPV